MSATKKITSLVSRLQSNRGVQTRKDAIRDFTNWFSSAKPELDAADIKLLLSGDKARGYSIGIIQFCGKQKNTENRSASAISKGDATRGYQYKESVKLALELWVSCIHESFGNHAKSFQNELKTIGMSVYIEARLDLHIQMDEMKDQAGVLIDAIIFATGFKLSEIIANESGQKAFKMWMKEKKKGDGSDDDTDDGDGVHIRLKKKKATKWEEVKQEDLIIDEVGNDEWFETLDFVGKRNNNNNIVKNDDEDEETDSNSSDDMFDDPLGQQSKKAVRKCIERFCKKKKVFNSLPINNDIIDNYYQFSPNISDESFAACNFLVEIHSETDFFALQNGLDKIETFVRDQSHKMKELVSEHFDEFVYCKDTIDSIHGMLRSANNNMESTAAICVQLEEIERDAVSIYGNVLSRTKKAKILYETLQLIKQASFKFLFTLPQQIKYHIMMRNYDQIIRIYKRVQNIKGQIGGNSILNKILFELNATVNKLKLDLLNKLRESHGFGDEEERIILYLIELEVDGDVHPAIYLLKRRHEYIMTKLDETQIQSEHGQAHATQTQTQKKLIKKLSQIFISSIPSFWKLSESIIDHKFKQKKATDNNNRSNEHIVATLFGEISAKFIKYIVCAIAMDDNDAIISKDIMKLLLSAYYEIKSIKIRRRYIYAIDDLISSTTKAFLTQLFAKSLHYICSKLCKEKWKAHRDIAGVTTTPLIFSDHVCATLQIVSDIGMNIIYSVDDEYINNNNNNSVNDEDHIDNDDSGDESHSEDSRSSSQQYIPFKDDASNTSGVSNLSHKSKEKEYSLNALWLIPLIASYYIESHKMFADCLHELVYAQHDHHVNSHNNEKKTKINILSNYSDKSSDKKLLYILGNTIYTKETILERIWTKYMKKSGIIGIEYLSILESSKNDLIELYNSLEQMVFDRYVRYKTLLLNRVIDSSLLCDGINWETLSDVKGIRNHCLQLLLHFVFIHNEVYNSSKQELDNVLISLLEKVADHLLSTIKQIDSFSPSGALQILIEIDFIRSTLAKYLHPDGSHIVFQQIEQLLYQWIDQHHNIIQKRKEQLTLHTKQSTVVMFSCFSYDDKKN